MKFAKLNTAAQQREAIVQGRSLLPYRLSVYLYDSAGKHLNTVESENISFRVFFVFFFPLE
ncbi:MAG: hypothetical protein LBK06_06125 [Planctomycetaceae bacterium]|nr:hypothetical protein [Planctomycetaceae bacterium]